MTDVYVDTSALIKRIFVERESDRLRAILRERSTRGDLLVSSQLTWVEVSRAIMLAGAGDIAANVGRACSGIASQRLDAAVLRRAERIGPHGLRALDAIHLSAAVSVGATELLTYDDRLADAARAAGLTVIS